MELRPYQQRAVTELRRAGKRVLLVLPTGGGKTCIASYVMKSHIERGGRPLFLAHRREIVDQTARTLQALGVDTGVIMSGRKPDPDRPCQVASVQSLKSLPPATMIFADEAHHVAAKSWLRIVDKYPDAFLFGLTATPIREDGKPLGGALFHRTLTVASYSELIAAGYLAEPRVYTTKPLDLRGVKRVAGDFAVGALAEKVSDPKLVGDVVRHWEELAGDRRTVVFAVSVRHAEVIRNAFLAAGVPVAIVTGETPAAERDSVGLALRSGMLSVVVNVGVYTEGWDEPSVKCAIIARPTQSLSLWMQMVGRILRPWGGVTPVVLDHGSNVDRHGLPHEDRTWSLDDGVIESDAPSVRVCKVCFGCYKPGPRVCPVCGAEQPIAERPDVTVDGDSELHIRMANPERDAQNLAVYQAIAEEAYAKGYKPGWVYHQYRQRAGAEMPKSFSSEIYARFARDKAWQARTAERTAYREQKAEENARIRICD